MTLHLPFIRDQRKELKAGVWDFQKEPTSLGRGRKTASSLERQKTNVSSPSAWRPAFPACDVGLRLQADKELGTEPALFSGFGFLWTPIRNPIRKANGRCPLGRSATALLCPEKASLGEAKTEKMGAEETKEQSCSQRPNWRFRLQTWSGSQNQGRFLVLSISSLLFMSKFVGESP